MEKPLGARSHDYGMFVYGHPLVDGKLVDCFPNLRGISNHGVGIDHIDADACQQRNIPVFNTPGVLDGAVADATFALLLAAARRVVPVGRLLRIPTPSPLTNHVATVRRFITARWESSGLVASGNKLRAVRRVST